MKQIINKYLNLRTHKYYFPLLIAGIILFGASAIFNYAANNYTALHASGRVTDLFLDNLPVKNVDEIFYEGTLMLELFVILLALHEPKRIPFMLKSTALFIFVRSFFMILTHFSPPINETLTHPINLIQRLTAGSGYDLFFSGHTGFPFLMALLFWNNKYLRSIFIASSIVFGAAVLFGHLHYSIDVFSAFFITFGIYHIAMKIFKRDFDFFQDTVKTKAIA
ncbi:hypothetical protein D4R52_01365 [bacterium]|nr:MAG: hypothetical protein D4R52_01365 [bacterium]